MKTQGLHVPRVAILMSTYNGEKYLSEQLDSILNQQGVDIYLYIRDDGSSDSTMAILRAYAEKNSNLILKADGKNLGPGASFLCLFYSFSNSEETFDYVAFADQDDIWLPDKMLCAIQVIEQQTPAIQREGILYGSNQILYRDGKQEGLRHAEKQDLTLAGHLSKNTISGCTMVLNWPLAQKIFNAPQPQKEIVERRMHDSWIILAAIACGNVIYDEEAHILYRIHQDNVVGIKKPTLRNRIAVKWKNITQPSFACYRSRTALQLLRSFPEIDGRKREILEEVAYYKSDLKEKRKLLSDTELVQNFGRNAVTGRLKILLNLI